MNWLPKLMYACTTSLVGGLALLHPFILAASGHPVDLLAVGQVRKAGSCPSLVLHLKFYLTGGPETNH